MTFKGSNMIAKNFRKHPEAMALQMVLPFGRVLVWALPRPTTRVLRAIRAARAAAFKQIGRIVYPDPAVVPQWWRDVQGLSKAFAAKVKTACMTLI